MYITQHTVRRSTARSTHPHPTLALTPHTRPWHGRAIFRTFRGAPGDSESVRSPVNEAINVAGSRSCVAPLTHLAVRLSHHHPPYNRRRLPRWGFENLPGPPGRGAGVHAVPRPAKAGRVRPHHGGRAFCAQPTHWRRRLRGREHGRKQAPGGVHD
jgi:hypothetical protein